MTVNDLEDGYLVKLKNGKFGIIVTDDLGKMVYGNDSRLAAARFYSSECIYDDYNYDIVEVWGHLLGTTYIWSTKHRQLLWKAEPLAVTMEDIEKKFGRPIIIVEKSN